MPQIINTNLASLTAQNALNNSQNTLNTAMQQLSTGLSINSAADNAAGLAIVTGMQSQINGDTVAEQNANDGISMAQTAGSALTQITNDLQTIRQLAVQSANGTNTASNRQQINTEVQQEIAEVSRISQQTSFNGLSLLTGQLGNNVSFQIGADVGQVINMDFSQGTQSNQIGQLAKTSATAATLSAAFTSGAGLTLGASGTTNTLEVGSTYVTGNFTSAASLITAINTAAGSTVASASGNEIKITGATGGTTITGTGTGAALGLDGTVASGSTETSTGVNAAVTAPGTASPLTLASGDLTLQVGSGSAVNITGTFANSQDLVAAINAQAIPGVQAYLDSEGNMQLTSQSALTVGGTSAATLGLTAGSTATSGSLQGGDVLTVDDSNSMIATVDAAIAQVSTLQSNLGAMQNRFNSVVANLQSGSENLSASQSSIQDTDFAAVTATLSRSQILQQSGISMLAQANSQPQLVLKLLQ